MLRRRSIAVLVLMVVLAVAPSLAVAAAACADVCCPASAERAEDGDDCRSRIAQRTCCDEAPAPLAAFAPAPHEVPSFQAILPPADRIALEKRPAPPRRLEPDRALRTSPLRLSVVLLI